MDGFHERIGKGTFLEPWLYFETRYATQKSLKKNWMVFMKRVDKRVFLRTVVI